jgi:hypothetical protein
MVVGWYLVAPEDADYLSNGCAVAIVERKDTYFGLL